MAVGSEVDRHLAFALLDRRDLGGIRRGAGHVLHGRRGGDRLDLDLGLGVGLFRLVDGNRVECGPPAGGGRGFRRDDRLVQRRPGRRLLGVGRRERGLEGFAELGEADRDELTGALDREAGSEQATEGEERHQNDRGAGRADAGGERDADHGTEVATGVTHGVGRVRELRRASGEVEQAGRGQHDEEHAESDPQWRRDLVVGLAPEQQHRDREERGGYEEGAVPEQGGDAGRHTPADGAGEPGREGEPGQGGEREQRERDRIGAVTAELGPGRLLQCGRLARLGLCRRPGPGLGLRLRSGLGSRLRPRGSRGWTARFGGSHEVTVTPATPATAVIPSPKAPRSRGRRGP